jgi:hypothetical protein
MAVSDAGSTIGARGVLQFATPAMLEAEDLRRQQYAAAVNAPAQPTVSQLGGYIRSQFEIFRNHRNTASGWSNRLIEALRVFNGQYSTTKEREISKFGGSQVYARMTAQKCRAASSLLRDVYLGADRPWSIRPPPEPEVPPEILQSIDAMLQHEAVMVQQQTGQRPPPDAETERKRTLIAQAEEVAKKKAAEQARNSEDKIEELLREGQFYHAFAEFLVDLPIFPFAVIKGPVVKIIPVVKWRGGQPNIQQIPRLMWARVSPFDIWWTPGVADIANANVIEKSRLTRAELNDLLDLPGYDQAEVRAALQDYARGGLNDYWDPTDAERAVLESRENPAWNRSGLITMMEFHGNVQGEILQDYGMPGVSDPLRDYHVDAFVIGNHVIKANLSPSPRARHNYFITSFEKVPGTPVGNGLTDMIADLQDVANACLRSLVNNISISSGPQVVVNDDRCRPEDNTDELYPWKRWHVTNDPVSNNAKPPVDFFSPQSNAQDLLTVFKAFQELADDVSAIPKYIGGQAGSGGAGRTASGLAMLMGNASKILQTVAANIDRDVIEISLQQLSDLVLLSDTTGVLTGEEDIYVQGVNVAVQRETQRQRQLEFLQHTNNPVDMEIMGIVGRGSVLRAVAQTIGLDGEVVVPDDQTLEKKQKEQGDQKQTKAINEEVDKGIQAGVELGIQKFTAEIIQGYLAASAQPDLAQPGAGQPGGPPPLGPPGPPGAGGPPSTGVGGPPRLLAIPGGMADMAAQAQGARLRRCPMLRRPSPVSPVANRRMFQGSDLGRSPEARGDADRLERHRQERVEDHRPMRREPDSTRERRHCGRHRIDGRHRRQDQSALYVCAKAARNPSRAFRRFFPGA